MLSIFMAVFQVLVVGGMSLGLLQKKDRVGGSPVLHLMEWLKNIDVDWEEDFYFAETLFNRLNER